MMNRWCSQIMKKPVKSITDRDSIHAAAAIMRDAGVGFLPVCDASGKVVGVVTDRDIVTRAAADGKTPLDGPVSAIMSRDLVTCSPSDSISYAVTRMRDRNKSRIICVDDQGRPVGIINDKVFTMRMPARVTAMMRAFTPREVRA